MNAFDRFWRVLLSGFGFDYLLSRVFVYFMDSLVFHGGGSLDQFRARLLVIYRLLLILT